MKSVNVNGFMVPYRIVYKKNKHTYLRVKNGCVIISTNLHVKEKDVILFIKNNIDLIKKKLSVKINDNDTLIKDSKYRFNNTIYSITVIISSTNQCYITGNSFIVKTKINESKYIEKIVYDFEKKYIANIINDIYKRVYVNTSKYLNIDNIIFKYQKMKSRWGSCNSSNRIIKLNTKLLMYPLIYIEYILFHEITHLKIHNHSSKFYDFFSLIYPQYIKKRIEFKNIVKT